MIMRTLPGQATGVQALSGLGQLIGQERQQAAMQQQMQADSAALIQAMQAGDQATVNEIALRNPDLIQRFKAAQPQNMMGKKSQLPANIREFEYFQQLPTEDQEEYLRVQRGEKITPEQQFQLAQDKAALEVETTQTKEERKQGVKALQAIAGRQKAARQDLGTVNRLEKLNERAFSGLGASQKLALGKLAKQFGFDVEGLSESEQLQALSNELVLNKSQQMSGALSNADMEFLRDTAPTLSQTTEGRQKMLDYARALAERETEYAKAAQAFRKEKGYFNQAEFEQEFDANNRPLFADEVINEPQEELSIDELIQRYGN